MNVAVLVLLPASFLLFSHGVFHAASFPGLDHAIHSFFASWATPSTIAFFRWISHWGEWRFLFPPLLALCVWLLFLRRWKASILLFLAVAISMRTNAAIKILTSRPRPEAFDPIDLPPSLAYPSGHALAALVFYFLVYYLVGKIWPNHRLRKTGWGIVSLLIFLVGLSRLGLGVHWATDVLGGWIFGAFWVALTLSIGRKGRMWDAAR